LSDLKDQIGFLPGAKEAGQMSALSRAILKMHADVAVKAPEALDAAALLNIHKDLAALSDLITSAYLR
jgi:hypothetical protein